MMPTANTLQQPRPGMSSEVLGDHLEFGLSTVV
jgi:hypothetical protein